MDPSEITNVLIFKDGYYYLTYKVSSFGHTEVYVIAEGLEHNGFEFASDAYSYLAHLTDKEKKNEK